MGFIELCPFALPKCEIKIFSLYFVVLACILRRKVKCRNGLMLLRIRYLRLCAFLPACLFCLSNHTLLITCFTRMYSQANLIVLHLSSYSCIIVKRAIMSDVMTISQMDSYLKPARYRYSKTGVPKLFHVKAK